VSDEVQATNDTTTHTPEQTAEHAPVEQATPSPANMPATTKQPEPETVDSLPGWAQDLVRGLRDENAKHRNKAKHAAEEAAAREKELATQARDQLVNEFAKVLGLGGEEEQDPQALLDAANQKTSEQQKRIDELVAQVNDYKRTEAINAAIGNRNVNKRLLTAVLKLDNAFTDVDVTDDNFADQVSEAVKRAIDENPELVQATPGKSGIDPTNTTSEKPITRDDLTSMSPEDINKAYRDGRLNHLLNS
jgi:hypothetical protein